MWMGPIGSNSGKAHVYGLDLGVHYQLTYWTDLDIPIKFRIPRLSRFPTQRQIYLTPQQLAVEEETRYIQKLSQPQ